MCSWVAGFPARPSAIGSPWNSSPRRTPGTRQTFDLKVEAFEAVDRVLTGQDWLPLEAEKFLDGVRAVLGGTADVRSLTDNYLIMRYGSGTGRRGTNRLVGLERAATGRGLDQAGAQRHQSFQPTSDGPVPEPGQHRCQPGHPGGPRWEGDVALNLDSINDYGLIEIYETVLRRGRMLSIDAGINYGPANDALLLAAGYLNDLYMMVVNEAWADAANPTIGIGTKDKTYGDIATRSSLSKARCPRSWRRSWPCCADAMISCNRASRHGPSIIGWFGTTPAGLIPGRSSMPSTTTSSRTRTRASMASWMPTMRGGCSPRAMAMPTAITSTALKGYYSLLMDNDFDWVPRTEAVNVLGKPVQVDYLDEREVRRRGCVRGPRRASGVRSELAEGLSSQRRLRLETLCRRAKQYPPETADGTALGNGQLGRPNRAGRLSELGDGQRDPPRPGSGSGP